MIVDPMLALFGDRLFMATVGVYVLALVLHSAQYALARAATPATPAVANSTVSASVDVRAALSHTPGVRAGLSHTPGARAGLSHTPGARAALSGPPGSGETGAGGRSRGERLGRMAVAMVVLGALLHAGSLVTRGLATARWPLGNMYEFTSAICLAAVVAWLVLLHRTVGGPAVPGARDAEVSRAGVRRAASTVGAPAGVGGSERFLAIGPFVLLPVVVLLFLAGTVLYAQAAPVQPALQSYWLVVHVTTICLSSGMLLVAGVASLLYLLRRAGWAQRLPTADVLDRLAYRVTIIAFPVYTFAVIAGAIWAEAAWGRFWGWDPKETVAFVAWVVYAAYLHARATAGWRTGRAAWVNVAGFAVIAFNLFFINMVVAGLHSYAGI